MNKAEFVSARSLRETATLRPLMVFCWVLCMLVCLAMLVIMQDLATNGIGIVGSKYKTVCILEREREGVSSQRQASILTHTMSQFQNAGGTSMDAQGGSSNECLGNSS